MVNKLQLLKNKGEQEEWFMINKICLNFEEKLNSDVVKLLPGEQPLEICPEEVNETLFLLEDATNL